MPKVKKAVNAPAAKKSPATVVADWNAKHPVGTDVTVTMDDGTEIQSKTTSTAWVLGDHTPCVIVADISGAYDLTRVKPNPKPPTPAPKTNAKVPAPAKKTKNSK